MSDKIIQLKENGDNLFPQTSQYGYATIYLNMVGGTLDTTTGKITADSSDTPTNVVTACTQAVPYVGVTLHFHMPSDVTAAVYTNDATKIMDGVTKSLTNSVLLKDNIADGGTCTFGKATSTAFAQTFYRIVFLNTGNHTLDELREKIEVTFLTHNDSVMMRNMDVEPLARTAGYTFNSSNLKRPLNNMPLLVHASDFHNDVLRYMNFVIYANYIHADAALASGDFVAGVANDGSDYVYECSTIGKVPVLPCIGNHDAWSATSDESYNKFIKPCVSDATQTWYYKDFAEKQMRIIVLNEYVTSTGGWQNKDNFTEAQKKWFIETLLSTPANYCVLIEIHSLENGVDKDSRYRTFYSWADDKWNNKSETKPIFDIMDAFIERKAVSGTWTDYSGSYAYSADFSLLNEGVEFVAYVSGHYHRDLIGYVNGTKERQLDLRIGCDNSTMNDFGNATGNWGAGKSQDLINVYGIDRDAKCVRVVRIGCNASTPGAGERQQTFMVIPYADGEAVADETNLVTFSDMAAQISSSLKPNVQTRRSLNVSLTSTHAIYDILISGDTQLKVNTDSTNADAEVYIKNSGSSDITITIPADYLSNTHSFVMAAGSYVAVSIRYSVPFSKAIINVGSALS